MDDLRSAEQAEPEPNHELRDKLREYFDLAHRMANMRRADRALERALGIIENAKGMEGALIVARYLQDGHPGFKPVF